jgi:hypothetical protein
MSTLKIGPRPSLYSPIRLQVAPPVDDLSYEGATQISETPTLDRLTGTERPMRGRILRLEIFVLATLIGSSYFAWRTLKQEDALQQIGLSQNRSLLNLAISVTNGNAKVNALTKSVEAVTATLAQSSSQINVFSDQLGQRQNEMQYLEDRLHGVEIALRKSQQVRSQATTDTVTPLTIGQRASVSWAASSSRLHTHQVDMSIPMPGGALAHINSQHELDYWMVSRMLPLGERTVKVQPYGTNSLGVKVHSLDDGMDYILTPQGGWMEGLEQQ